MSVTVQGVIEKVDGFKSNTYDVNAKLDWINTIEAMISKEVTKTVFTPLILPENAENILTADAPYDIMYEYYLKAMIDYNNNDYFAYNNNIAMFNAAFDSYSKYIKSIYNPTAITIDFPDTSTHVKNIW